MSSWITRESVFPKRSQKSSMFKLFISDKETRTLDSSQSHRENPAPLLIQSCLYYMLLRLQNKECNEKPKLFIKSPNKLHNWIILQAHTYTHYKIQTIDKTALKTKTAWKLFLFPLPVSTNSDSICRWRENTHFSSSLLINKSVRIYAKW